VFSWTQARFLLPSWYGVGTALQEFVDEAPEEHLKVLRYFYSKWPFFKMVISKVEMTLAKVDLQIAEHYVRELTSPEDQERFLKLFDTISQEFYMTRDMVLRITGHERLLDGDPDLQRSVYLRNGTIVPLGLFAGGPAQAPAPVQRPGGDGGDSLALQPGRTAARGAAYHQRHRGGMRNTGLNAISQYREKVLPKTKAVAGRCDSGLLHLLTYQPAYFYLYGSVI
jgi:phosphoenolpyruvate carboxylase